MALPTTRQENHGAQSPIKGTTIDAIQDCIVGAKKPQLVRTFGPSGSGMWPPSPAGWNFIANGTAAGNYMISTGVTSAMIYFAMDVGDRITGITCRAYGDGAVDATFNAGYVDVANSQLQVLATATDTNRAAAYGDFAITPFTPRVLQLDEAIAVVVAPNAANYRVAKWFVTYDRL